MSLSSTKPPKTFTQTFAEIGYGSLSEEATAELQKCMDAVSEPGKKASLTITLEFKSKTNGQIIVNDKIVTKLPQKPREEHIMFQTAELHLTARDPRQRELEGIRPVVGTAQDGGVRTVDVALPAGDVKQVAADTDTVRRVG